MIQHRMSFLGVLCFTMLFACFAARPAYADIILTADEVATRVRTTSMTLTVRRADVHSAEAALDEARLALWPRLAASGFYARYSPISAPTLGNVVMGESPGPVGVDNLPSAVPLRFSVLLDSVGVQLGLTVPISDYLVRFPHTIAASKRALAATLAQGVAEENRVWHDGYSLYFAWARSVLQKEVADIAVEQARAHLALARSRQGAGTGLSTEAVRFDAEQANAELLQRKLVNLIDLFADQLRTSMHDTRTGRYILGETWDNPNADPAPLDFELCYQTALSHRAELISLSASADSEREQAKAVRALMFPQLEVYGLALGSNPNPRYLPAEDKLHVTWEIGARLSYSPNEWMTGRAKWRQHQARVESLNAERQQLVEAIRKEVLAAIQARQESVLALVSTRKRLGLAEDSLRVRNSLASEGRATHVEVTDAETDLVRARFAEVDARIDARLASIRLHRAMGTAK